MKTVTLTSTEMVHTPSIYRAFKVRFETETVKTLVAMLFSDVYRIRYTVARDILSGKIPVVINEEAGTVSFTTV